MKSKKITLLILVLLLNLFIFRAGAITPQNQTVHITDTHDDAFITEAGIGIDTSLVTILDPNMDIRAYLVFRELEINYWEPLENATLRLHTSTNLNFDADSSISIYGMKLSDLQLEGFLLPSTVLSIGYTTARTDYNTSEFYGQQWHEINVTDIVEELIRNPNWDGDGAAGTETGDAIGFHIVGAEGDDTRYFYDLMVGNGLEAQLVIHWNHEPPPPSGTGEKTYNSTYRGYDIWSVVEFLWMNYTDWVEVDAANKIDVFNSSYVELGTQFQASALANLHNNSRGPYDVGGWKFGVMISQIHDNEAGGKLVIVHLHALGEPVYQGGFRDYRGGSEYSVGFGITDYTDGTDDKFFFGIEMNFDGVGFSKFSDSSYDVNASRWYWVHIQYDLTNQIYNASVYNDYAMTDLEVFLRATPTIKILAAPYEHEFAVLGQHWAPYDAYLEGALRSTPEVDTATWSLVDENGTTVITDLPDYNSTLIWIDDLLGADPEDPNPPGEDWDETGPFTRFRTRLYILLLGFLMLLGPLFYMVARRPSGHEIVIGMFIMLIGYAFLRAAAGI